MRGRRRQATRAAYEVEFAESVQEHLRALTARERALVLDAVENQLGHRPLAETRHRKPLRPNPIAPWELRIRHLRIFYEVAADEAGPVRILAVGRKDRNVLKIGDEEIQL
jgi:mRNA-degrading endonuclease RelE of RelBE toxin-antitoxin system